MTSQEFQKLQEQLCIKTNQEFSHRQDNLGITTNQSTRQDTFQNKLQFPNSSLQDERNEQFKVIINFNFKINHSKN